ncbi:MAG: HD domain-containing protein [Verrucomicrobiae bacterium]|nr:HD domain-containing protein [Verrucomicrobiae bacterium]
MPNKRYLSTSTQLDLTDIVKNLHGLRDPNQTSGVTRKMGLLDLFGEEAKLLRDSGVKPSSVISVLFAALQLPAGSPLGRAGALCCAHADQSSDTPHYHNPHHIVEVLAAAYVLGRREKLPVYRVGELLVAASAHDLGHTGQNNQFDYERESVSVQIAHPLFLEAGLDQDVIERIARMIYATDFKVGVVWSRQNYHETQNLVPDDENRLLAAQCQLLTEADVLFSCFDLSYNEFLSKLLSAEWKRTGPNLTLAERIRFVSYVQFISKAAQQLGLEDRRQKLLRNLVRLQATQPRP